MKKRINKSRIFITGANGGIGKEVVKLLVNEQAKSIALACRTLEKAIDTKDSIVPRSTVLESYGGFDMTRVASIKEAVAKLPAIPFDIVFLQSGGMVVGDDFKLVESGRQTIEKTIYQNTFGAYLTLQYLFERDLIASNARIVFPGGEGARGIKGLIQKPEFKSVEDLERYITKGGSNKYSDIDALGVSKFMGALLVQKLATLDKNRDYVWFSPGLTSGTNGLKDVANPKRFIMEKIGFPIMNLLGLAQSPIQAAQKYVDSLSGKHGDSGDLIGAPEGKAIGTLVDQKPMNSGLTNYQYIDAFWKLIVNTCGELTFSK